jgi:hypothetical protein
MPQFDAAKIDEGRRAFEGGHSLAAVVRDATAMDEEPGLSFVLGFLSAAIDKLRGIER